MAARLAGWKRVTMAGVILYVMDGPYTACLLHTVPAALTAAAQLRADGISSCFYIFYVLLTYIVYVMQSHHFSQYPAFLSQTAKERDKKYIVKSPQRYKK